MFNAHQLSEFFYRNYLNCTQKRKLEERFKELFFKEFQDVISKVKKGIDINNHVFSEATFTTEKKIAKEFQEEFENKIDEICEHIKTKDEFIGLLVSKFLNDVKECGCILDAILLEEVSSEIKGKLYKEGIITLEGDLVDESNRL